jgi:hypothetical protein
MTPDDKRGMPRELDDHLVVELLASSGTGFTLSGAFRDGEGPGAYRIVDPSGGTAALKIIDPAIGERIPAVARAIDELRRRGYPAPRYLHTGANYVIQEFVAGASIFDAPSPAHIARVLELNGLQKDIGVDLPDAWPVMIVSAVLEGGDGFCLHDTMRAHSDETAKLLDELIELASRNAASVPARADLVHFDFHGANVLAVGREITGVIDLEAVRLGDRAFDLVTFMYYIDRELQPPLWERALELSGPGAIKVYFSHMILRQTEWSVRFHDETTVRDVVDRSRAVLKELANL